MLDSSKTSGSNTPSQLDISIVYCRCLSSWTQSKKPLKGLVGRRLRYTVPSSSTILNLHTMFQAVVRCSPYDFHNHSPWPTRRATKITCLPGDLTKKPTSSKASCLLLCCFPLTAWPLLCISHHSFIILLIVFRHSLSRVQHTHYTIPYSLMTMKHGYPNPRLGDYG
jgi:hypothetical protein